jgi:uncharacterized protein
MTTMGNELRIKPSVVVRDFFQELFDGLPQGDMTAVDRYMTPDVEAIVNGTTSPELIQIMTWAGKHVGSEAVKNFFIERMSRTVEILDVGTHEIIEQGTSAAFFGTLRIRARRTGAVIESEYALRIRIRDGKISEYHIFENTYHIAASFRVAGAWEVETAEGLREVPRRAEDLR